MDTEELFASLKLFPSQHSFLLLNKHYNIEVGFENFIYCRLIVKFEYHG